MVLPSPLCSEQVAVLPVPVAARVLAEGQDRVGGVAQAEGAELVLS